MALRGRRFNNFIELWCLVDSGGLDFCVSSTNFQKNGIGWPQQPQTKKVPKPLGHHKSIKSLILLPLRAIQNLTFQYETPCISKAKEDLRC